MGCADPVADLAVQPVDVVARRQADAANRLTVTHNGEHAERGGVANRRDEPSRVAHGVRVRKTVPQILGDQRIVRVRGKGPRIGTAQWTKHQPGRRDHTTDNSDDAT